jgi:hypothetical protein
MTLLHNGYFGNGIGFRFRPVYYDTLSLDAARPVDSTLSMLELNVIHSFADGKVWLRQLDIVNIETLNVSKTGLPKDGGYAWRIKFGLDSQYLFCNDCSIFDMSIGIGKAFKILDTTSIRSTLEFNAQTPYKDSGTLGGAAKIALVLLPTTAWKMEIMYKRHRYFNGLKTYSKKLLWENRIALHREWDFRINYAEDQEREFGMGISIYW